MTFWARHLRFVQIGRYRRYRGHRRLRHAYGCGELSVKGSYTHLTKALRPLPEKFHGLQDKEEARRRRYVDLIMNEESRRIAFMRPKIIRAIQQFFDDRGYVEVETPVLTPILGGAAARPFVTHHNTLDMDFYLRIATELPLKRLIVGGMEAVYEIGRLFRNEGMDSNHNPEFTTVEAYLAYGNIDDMMELAESLFEHLALKVLGTTEIEYQGHTISLKAPFARLHMVDGIKRTTGIDFFKITDLDEAWLAKEHGIAVPNHQKPSVTSSICSSKIRRGHDYSTDLCLRSSDRNFAARQKECPGSAFYRSV